METHPVTDPPSVLIVDDDADIALALHDLLAHVGYRVQVAGTGAEALYKARIGSFAVVLLDVMLPDMDGLSVLTLLKGIDPALPVIMLTAFVEVAKKYGSLTEGAFGYLTKPYDAEELKALVLRAVRVKDLSLQAASAKSALAASEQRFREVVQTAPDAIVLADGQGNILTWNDAAGRLFGYAAEEVLARPLTAIMPERYRQPYEEALSRVRGTGEFRLKEATVTMHGLHKNGQEFPVEMSLSSWTSDGRRFHCGIVRDITERVRAEVQLRRQQIEQQVLLDLIPAMVWYKDPHNRILRTNKRAAECINKSVADVEGRSTVELYPDEAEQYHRDDLEVIGSGQPKLEIVELYAATGEKRWIQTDKVPYRDAEGNMGVLVFSQDITERKRMVEALRESEQRLRAMVESARDGMLMANADGTILLTNSQLTRQFGYAEKDLIGRSLDQLIPERFRAGEGRFVFPTNLGHRVTDRRDLTGLRRDGSEFPLSIVLTPVSTAGSSYIVASIQEVPPPTDSACRGRPS